MCSRKTLGTSGPGDYDAGDDGDNGDNGDHFDYGDDGEEEMRVWWR